MIKPNRYLVKPGTRARLSDLDPTEDGGLSRDDAHERLNENIDRMVDLQHKLNAQGARSLLIVFQAMDAGGKDSTIRHVIGPMNPAGVRVTSFKRPTDEELSHDFLWRIHRAVPKRGDIAVFNRSHYEDVLVARVDKIVPEEVWKRRDGLIRAFESYLKQEGTEIVKIFLHLSKAEQRRKLLRRVTDPKRNWKFEPADFETRRKWDLFMGAYEDAISECSTDEAPWYVVPADVKWYRKLVVSEILREALERIGPEFPPARIAPEDALGLIERID